MNVRNVNFDNFCQEAEISKTGDMAEIIVDYCPQGPVRLIGFSTDSALTDYEILEEGFRYLTRFRKHLGASH